MELSLNYTFDGAAVIADSINHPAIRLFGAFWSKSPTPLNDTSNRWGGPSWRLNSPDALVLRRQLRVVLLRQHVLLTTAWPSTWRCRGACRLD